MDDLVSFLRQRLDEDEMWARGASRPYERAVDGSTAPETGVHWHWVAGDDWEPVAPNPLASEFIEASDGSWQANLTTVEEWRGRAGDHQMPRRYADSITEMDAAAAGHIARHDPARVLAEVDAKRRMLEWAIDLERKALDNNWWNLDDFLPFQLLSMPYASHPDYNEAWRP